MKNKNNKEELKLSIDEPIEKFEDFLSFFGNDQIIFSGTFGIGKTHFLKEFFKKHKKFIPIHIYPTNYSVASNEDIFELIKYDILYELLKLNPDFEKLKIPLYQVLNYLTALDGYKILKSFLDVIPKVGKPVLDMVNPVHPVLSFLEEIVKIVNERKAKLKQDDLTDIERFASEVENTKGSIYENDFYTQLIAKLISCLKPEPEKADKEAQSESSEEKLEREIVLIVDDLDRIDPEHIFRIINIFAVHFDVRDDGATNKFGLDRIILSCDVENIRNMFTNRFGDDVNFNGYIDKFYSREIFYFDNKPEIVKAVADIIYSVSSSKANRPIFGEYGKESQEFRFVVYIISSLIDTNSLNLRTLKKMKSVIYKSPRYSISRDDRRLENNQISTVEIFDFFGFLFGSHRNFLVAINEIKLRPIDVGIERSLKYILGDLLLIIDYARHLRDKNNTFSFENTERQKVCQIGAMVYPYTVSQSTYAIDKRPFVVYRGAEEGNRLNEDIFRTVLQEACKEYLTLKR